jgi:ABC-type lipoprotein export system ATPase subunit
MAVVLDDPLQSLDEVNALGFADFCRQLRRNRQVIVTTHDRRFGSLLARKLAPRTDAESALEITFDGWDRSGPTIEHTWRKPELVKLLMA